LTPFSTVAPRTLVHASEQAGLRLSRVFGVAVLCAMAALFMFLLPAAFISEDMIAVIAVGTALLLLLSISLSLSKAQAHHPRNVLFVVWWILLSSEEFFIRWNTSENTFAGQLSPAAYAEAGVWILVFLVLPIITIRSSRYFHLMLSGQYKWLTLFGLVCLLSCAYSPQMMFSLAWAFKLLLIILLLVMCSSQISRPEDLRLFLIATLWGFAFLAIEPVIRASFGPGAMYEEGRLGNVISPTGLSAVAGTLFLLSLTVGSAMRKAWVWTFRIAGVLIMLVAGGKAAIFAGVLSGLLFFLLQKRYMAVLGLLAVVSGVASCVYLLTPISEYLQEYSRTGQLLTLTGRSRLWEVTIPEILNRLWLGHGYVASKFIALQVEGVSWDAGHTHNGFLEVLYNNGLVGLVIFLLINAAIVRNLVTVIRNTNVSTAFNQIAVGCTVIYANLIANGLLNASFGGRAGGPFMMLLALVVISERLMYFVRKAGLPLVTMTASPSRPQYLHG
jgi:O-antigen ligase